MKRNSCRWSLRVNLEVGRTQAQAMDASPATTRPSDHVMPLNLLHKTAGGAQVWTDYRYRCGYRLQQHAITKHWRVLDESDLRRAWGTREACQQALDNWCPRVDAEEKSHYVILLHGLMRTSRSMLVMEKALQESGYPNVIRFSYASTRCSIGHHAAALRELMEDLPDNATFSFIGHSMGNIVVRHLVGDLQRDGDPQHLLSRCQSMVMLGPPNQGATIAKRLAPTGLFGIITGQGGQELGPKWDAFAGRLGTPPFPFMIVAGDLSHHPIKNPLVTGPSDFIVSLEEVELEGRETLLQFPVLHSFLMRDREVIQASIDFLRTHS